LKIKIKLIVLFDNYKYEFWGFAYSHGGLVQGYFNHRGLVGYKTKGLFVSVVNRGGKWMN